MANKLKLGVIGMSEGNGHPYSWSAIFNGYDKLAMKECPFPIIPEYLSRQSFPEDGLGHLGEVTHIWTQDKTISADIANASKILNVVEHPEDMINHVDAILLARDDAENHEDMARPFIKAGLPIFIDKPLALSKKEAENIINSERTENQIFTCSSLRFAEELKLSLEEKRDLGDLIHIEAQVPNKWDTYAIHLIEPIIELNPERGNLISIHRLKNKGIHSTLVQWENISAYLKVTGKLSLPLRFKFYGVNGVVQKDFLDSYSCFKRSLEKFINVIRGSEPNINRNDTLEAIEILENGR
ncbi:Gfo/Idh/MocA family oxidoreductase [Gramella sp. MAR_2010_147]|uniref:Gfo/Idh/MocA family oxidoreductase n=1 Tax=Gramella sp. MAR_2010_147 TaxID=1250205 RepID=UPI00087CF631|nr:Gfo/Idh/MocA family oxidoreductase [Gramella sp. MAR_2010_147]SDR69519.1 hypothetical protein SAMN04488553_0325 [Gramella sp. MAR_2010_147]